MPRLGYVGRYSLRPPAPLLVTKKRMPLLTALLVAAHVATTTAVAGAPAAPTAPAAVAPPRPHLRAVRTTTPPVIDGVLDDAVWKTAGSSSAFTQKYPNEGTATSEQTTVYVLYDDTAVYVAFDCPQVHTPIVQRLTRRDRGSEADSVQFDLGTRGDHKSSFEFNVNSSGTLIDAIRFNDTDYSSDWDENWEARTDVTDHGWSAEFRIPLRVLRFPALPVQSWDFQASRYISGKQENDDWAYFPRSVAGEVSHYGRLDGLEGLEEKTPMEFRPFLVGRVRRRDPAVGQLASGWDTLVSGGLDLKWHPTPGLTLDATFNPDFAQVEADQVVLNLSTVETYYPEKRPFFLEGIDAFQTPFQLLYTRRIGRVPLIPALRTDPVNKELLVDVPEPSAIYGATKLTGTLGKGWSVGTIQAVTAENTVQVQEDYGSRVQHLVNVTRLVDPTSSFEVVRLKHDLGGDANIAFMGTAVTHAEPTETYPLQAPSESGLPKTTELCPNPVELTPLVQTTLNPAPNARCFNDVYVGAVDWRWRSPGGDYATGGQVAASVLENGPVRPVADGTMIHNGDIGVGTQEYINKEGGKHWTGGINTDVESRAFEINDLGYNSRANQISVGGNVQHRELDPFGPFLETHAFLYYGTTYDWGGLLVGQGLYLGGYGRFKNFWFYNIDVHYRGTKYDDREVGDGTALQRDGRFGTEVSFYTDSRKRFVFGFDQIGDAIYDGFNMSGNASVSVRFLPQWDLDLLPTWSWTAGEPRFMDEPASQNGQYLFGQLDARSIGVTLRTTYTFLPRLTLQGYAQLFLASGHYTQYTQFQSDSTGPRPAIQLSELTPYSLPLPSNPDFEYGVLNINLVLRWEYMLGSTLYLVYTRSQTPSTVLNNGDVGGLNLSAVGQAPASDVILAKLSFWFGV